MTVYFLLAAYNEEKGLPKVLEGIEAGRFNFDYKILVVDDGSLDNTRSIALRFAGRMPIEVVSHKANQGLGAALRTGFTELNGRMNDNDIIVTMDSDGTHPVETVAQLTEKIHSGFDVAIASRYSGGKEIGLALYRSLLSRIVNMGMRVIFGFDGVKDYTSGYRAFSGRIVKEGFKKYGGAFITEKGFTATPELLVKTALLNANICEVPLVLHYELKSGASKMKVFKTINRYFVLFWKLNKLKEPQQIHS